jgi:hypothetical protein
MAGVACTAGAGKMIGRRPVYFYFILTAILAWSCTANSARIPPWTADTEASFPNRDFIAQKGYGSDKRNAETDALSAISRYFSTRLWQKGGHIPLSQTKFKNPSLTI